MSVAFIWAVVSTNYWVILPAQALFGIGWTFRSGADTAWVTDELKGMGRATDAHVERLLIRKHQFGIVVAIAALLSVRGIGTLTTDRAAILVIGALSFLRALWMAAFMGEEHFTPGRDRERGFGETLRDGFSVVRTRPRLRLLVAVLFVLEMGSEAFDRLGHKFFLDEGGWGDDSLIGLWVLFTALSIAGLAVNGFAGRALVAGSVWRGCGDPACGCVSWRFSHRLDRHRCGDRPWLDVSGRNTRVVVAGHGRVGEP